MRVAKAGSKREYNIAAVVILALETVTRTGSVALLDGGRVRAAIGRTPEPHGTRLPGEAIAFLAEHGRTLADVDFLSVVTGPARFTGLRIGLATVQGLAMPAGKRVIPCRRWKRWRKPGAWNTGERRARDHLSGWRARRCLCCSV
jgi:tRNA threonylcarbamoyl adenosine modification protein YeaZ